MNWTRVTRQNPCGICEKGDWCTRGTSGWCCMRIQSDHPLKNGGWFHPFDGEKQNPPIPPPVPQVNQPAINPAKMLRQWNLEMPVEVLNHLAGQLGISFDSVEKLGCVWAPPHRAWAFPMRDGYGEIVGIRLRADDGRKWAVRGSKQGIFIPDMMPQSVVYLPEGPTSTAAALTLGLYAIGRPSCSTGGPEIKTALKRLGVSRAVIVADNDDKPDGLRPGFDGAQKLAKEIGVRSVIWMPPTKDIRDFLRQGGTAQLIQSEIRNFVWKSPK